MFGPAGIRRAQELKAEADKATERITVSRAEFIRLMVADGKIKKDAELQAKLCATLGSAVLIGGRMVSIRDGT